MIDKDDIIPLAVLGGGLFLIGMAARKPKRKLKDRTGEECDPDGIPPFGYECAQTRGGYELRKEPEKFMGFGHYRNRDGIDAALEKLGFPGGNLAGFQGYMGLVYGRGIRTDGELDSATIRALEDAEAMLARDEWAFPRGGGAG